MEDSLPISGGREFWLRSSRIYFLVGVRLGLVVSSALMTITMNFCSKPRLVKYYTGTKVGLAIVYLRSSAIPVSKVFVFESS
jgi:hypothetical protein